MDFSEAFRKARERADLIEKGQVAAPKQEVQRKPLTNSGLHVKLYTLVKIEGDSRKAVAFGMTYDEAEKLSRALVKKMRLLNVDSDSGGPMFEITQTEIEKEN
jgi:hypothetical protein